MAPVGKHLGLEIRQLIIKLNFEGKSVREIAEIVGKGKSTVHDIIKRYRDEFRLEYKSRQGQGKKISAREERKILIEVKKNPFKPVKELKIGLEERSGVTVCDETVRNVLRKNDFHGRIARNKPFISNKNKKLRIAFAKDYLLKSPEFWNTVSYRKQLKITKTKLYCTIYRLFIQMRVNLIYTDLTASLMFGESQIKNLLLKILRAQLNMEEVQSWFGAVCQVLV